MKVLKVRELVDLLKSEGAVAVRIRGSHQVWRLPDGRSTTIVVNHMNADATRRVLASVRRFLVGNDDIRGSQPSRDRRIRPSIARHALVK